VTSAPPATIRFDAAVYELAGSTLLRLPDRASRKLRSRGQVAVHGSINGHDFDTVLEPDGRSGHWMRIDEAPPGTGRQGNDEWKSASRR
jgi:hypothetical protein